MKLHGDSGGKRQNGKKPAPEYYVWENMMRRCTSPTCPSYHRYGARGIRVCRRWQQYTNFLADMGRRPSKEFSIERINNDGHYSPTNCRWATVREQASNTRRNRFITAKGETLTHSEWARRLGAEVSTVRSRIRLGWSEFDAVTKPIQKRCWHVNGR